MTQQNPKILAAALGITELRLYEILLLLAEQVEKTDYTSVEKVLQFLVDLHDKQLISTVELAFLSHDFGDFYARLDN